MMRKILMVLSLAGLMVMASAGDAFAQRGGGGGRGSGASFSGRAGGVGAGRGAYSSPRYGNSYYGRAGYYQGYGYGSGYYQPFLGAGILGAGIIANSYYNSMPYYGVAPGIYSYPAPLNSQQSFYSGPANQQQPATMTVIVPTADAQVWFENTATTQQGMERSFESPPLEPNHNFNYTIKVRWLDNGQTITQERRVNVQAGQNSTINFRGN
jgi:uncharacterized protein (TIGR03000 family)